MKLLLKSIGDGGEHPARPAETMKNATVFYFGDKGTNY